ncbi:MAG: hypothetical protein O6944_10135, partial [Gammaproteobacteria bacterium]|nr:hypothetical protein [Gammaproteobacteria bacterium]
FDPDVFNPVKIGRFGSQNEGDHRYLKDTSASKTKRTMEATLEERIEVLEKQVATLLLRLGLQTTEKDWPSTIGMFADDPVMKAIQTEGRKIREADRGEANRDHP